MILASFPGHPILTSSPGTLAVVDRRADPTTGVEGWHFIAEAKATPAGWTWQVSRRRGTCATRAQAVAIMARAAGPLPCSHCSAVVVWHGRPDPRSGGWRHVEQPTQLHTAFVEGWVIV